MNPRDFGGSLSTKPLVRSVNGHIEEARTRKVLDTPEETDTFRLCNLPYIEPSERTTKAIPKYAEPVEEHPKVNTP